MTKDNKPDKPERQSDTHPDSGSTRRRLLKTAVLGGAAAAALKLAPEQWSRPMVRSVTLPAHAQTSPPAASLPEGPWSGGAGLPNGGPERSRGLGQRLLDFLVPKARGTMQQNPCPVGFEICIEPVDDQTISVRWAFDGFAEGGPNEVQVDDTLAFEYMLEQFDEQWMLSGVLNEAGTSWTGNINGPCPNNLNLTRRSRDKGLFGIELMRSAHAGGQQYEDLDLEWTADEGPCSLGEE